MRTRVTLFSAGFSDLNGDFKGILDELNAAFAEVPDEYKSAVKIESDRGYEYGDETVEVYYCRPETDEEAAKRKTARQAQLDHIAARELEMLARLKSKYEG
jgi:hypothetical protein